MPGRCQDAKLLGGGSSTSLGTRKPGQSSGSTSLRQITFPLHLCSYVLDGKAVVFLLPGIILKIKSENIKAIQK